MENTIFVIRNQLEQYWTRSGEWVDGREPQRVMKLKHRDEAINQMVELSARDIDLRATMLEVPVGERGDFELVASAHETPTLAERAAANREAEARALAAEGEAPAEGEAAGEEPAATAEV